MYPVLRKEGRKIYLRLSTGTVDRCGERLCDDGPERSIVVEVESIQQSHISVNRIAKTSVARTVGIEHLSHFTHEPSEHPVICCFFAVWSRQFADQLAGFAQPSEFQDVFPCPGILDSCRELFGNFPFFV